MTAILLAALIGIQPVEAHTGHRHQARPNQHHQRSYKPRAVPHKQWVWVVGHWQRKGHKTVWIWGHWDLRPVAHHRHQNRCGHRG